MHLVVNALAMWVVCSRFASKLRFSFVLVYFTLFSAASSYLYYRFCKRRLKSAAGGGPKVQHFSR